jgi:hypothetical protein
MGYAPAVVVALKVVAFFAFGIALTWALVKWGGAPPCHFNANGDWSCGDP